MRKAIVIGATGLVGGQLMELLLNDSRFESVKIFVRRTANITHPKLTEHIVDFDAPDTWKKLVTGDVLYSAMGTTLRVAGSKEAQYKIDYTYQYNVARTAAANEVKEYVLISSAGAAIDSKIFYSRMKGELERDIKRLPFETIHIIRPGLLAGERVQVRTGEKIGIGGDERDINYPRTRQTKAYTRQGSSTGDDQCYLPACGRHTHLQFGRGI